MKIFPLRPMSSYDRIENFMKIIENHKHMHTVNDIPAKTECKYAEKVNIWSGLINKYGNKISEMVAGIKKNHG